MESNRYRPLDIVDMASRAAAEYPGVSSPDAPVRAAADALLATADYQELQAFTNATTITPALAHYRNRRVLEPFRQTKWAPTEKQMPGYRLLNRHWGAPATDVPATSSEVLRVEGRKPTLSTEEKDEIVRKVFEGHGYQVRGSAEDKPQRAPLPEGTPLDEPHYINLSDLADKVNARRHQHARRVFLGWIGLGAIAGGVGAGVFSTAYGKPIVTSYTATEKVTTTVPYAHTQRVSEAAGARNATASNYVVPPSTTAVDAAAFKPLLAQIQGQGLKDVRISVAIHGESSEAPVNGGNFYTLPPAEAGIQAEQADLKAEERVALERAQAAKAGIVQAAAGYDVAVTGLDGTMVPPTEAQRTAIEAAAEASHTTVAAMVAAFEHDPASVPEKGDVRQLLTEILSDNQGFSAVVTVQGEKQTTREVPVTKTRTERAIDNLVLAKEAVVASSFLLGGIIGGFAGSIRSNYGGAKRRAQRAAAKYRKPH